MHVQSSPEGREWGQERASAVPSSARPDESRRLAPVAGLHSPSQGRGMVLLSPYSSNYLPLYVAEFEFRYNNRSNDDIFGAAISAC